ncbi:MAG: hypothetical protein AAF633_15725 [Chloroflexota bacterium]
MNEVESKLTVLETDILEGIRQDRQLADANDIWQGAGSDAFSEELSTKVEPEIEDLLASMREFLALINQAAENVDTMDNTLSNEVVALDAEFKAIYTA